MKSTVTGLSLAVALLAAGLLTAEDKKIEWNAKKGDSALFTLKRSSSSEGGNFSQKENTEIQYKIEVADRKDNGDLELKVAYAKVNSKQESGDSTWEFDSSKKDGGDESVAYLRDVAAKPVTVKVTGGKIEISGLSDPESPGQGGDREGFRVYARKSLLSRRSLESDLDLILARAVHAQPLESGKEYRLARPEGDGQGGEGRRRGGFGSRGSPRVIFKYQGEEKVADQGAAKFALSVDPTRRQGGDAPAGENKSEGTALVSTKDGLLLKLDVQSSSKFEGERNGQTFSSTRNVKISITRDGAPKKDRETV